MRREIYVFKPEWDGALMKCAGGKPSVLAHAGGGRSLPASQGRAFDPTDIEVGPDGSVYIASWGRGYGGVLKDGKQIDEGRIYRISYTSEGRAPASPASNKTRDSRSSSLPDLIAALGSHMSHVRTDAQAALLDRAGKARPALLSELKQPDLTPSHETWILWTLGRLFPKDEELDAFFSKIAGQSEAGSRNRRIQALRILAHRGSQSLLIRLRQASARQASAATRVLKSPYPRLRHEAVQAIWQSRLTAALNQLINRAAVEDDRVTYHTLWKAIRDLAPESKRRVLLKDQRPGVRLAALLGLLEDNLATPAEVGVFQDDHDPRVAALATSWLIKTGLIKPKTAGARKPEPIAYIPRTFVSSLRSHSGRRYTFDPIGLAVGKPYYTDRDYRITELPDEMIGVPYILAANNDDRLLTPTVFSFKTDTPVTLYLGTGTRNNAPLAWMKINQPDGFQSTDLHIKTQDATYQLHRKEYPAGTISLGPNVNHPRDSGRGHYLIVLDRPILSPPAQPTTVETALAAMPKADAERGRDLFHHPKGAGCFNCHQLEKHGNVFAPDLSDIGAGADAKTLIESIIHPSKVVTEGFAAQVFETKEDFSYSGIVIEETGASVKLAQATGQTVSIPKFKIRSRKATPLSAMPAGFEHTMNPQQIADLTAYLLAQKMKAEPESPKKPFTAKFTERTEGFTFDETQDELRIFLGKQRIATYLKDHDQLTRRAFVNVSTPGGIQVTRNWPARKPEDRDPGYRGEDGIIHPIMHPGLWMGFGWIDGNDYWRLQARVVHDGWIKGPTGSKDEATFTARNRYLSKDGDRTVCVETCRIRFLRRPEGVLLDWDSSFQSDERDFLFGDQEESGLAIRVASPIRVQGGNGTITNNRGETNGAGTWGKPMKWIDYSGTIQGKRVGLLVMPHPDNPRPSWSHSRDYGVVVSNPFLKQPKERRQPYVTTPVKKGEMFRLRYGVLVYETGAGSDVSAIAEELLGRR